MPRVLALVIPALLVAVALYFLLSPRMTDEDAHQRLSQAGYAPVAAAIGAYDGFFGPGTGSFFTASLVALRGLGLTRATALTKLLNLTSNVASVLLFALGGQMWWLLGLCMAAGAMHRRLHRLAHRDALRGKRDPAAAGADLARPDRAAAVGLFRGLTSNVTFGWKRT